MVLHTFVNKNIFIFVMLSWRKFYTWLGNSTEIFYLKCLIYISAHSLFLYFYMILFQFTSAFMYYTMHIWIFPFRLHIMLTVIWLIQFRWICWSLLDHCISTTWRVSKLYHIWYIYILQEIIPFFTWNVVKWCMWWNSFPHFSVSTFVSHPSNLLKISKFNT